MEMITDSNLLEDVRKNMEAASQIIDELKSKGYHCHFQLQGSKLKCVENDLKYHHLIFNVDEIFRFDVGILQSNGFSIFALSHREDDLRGIFIAI